MRRSSNANAAALRPPNSHPAPVTVCASHEQRATASHSKQQQQTGLQPIDTITALYCDTLQRPLHCSAMNPSFPPAPMTSAQAMHNKPQQAAAEGLACSLTTHLLQLYKLPIVCRPCAASSSKIAGWRQQRHPWAGKVWAAAWPCQGHTARQFCCQHLQAAVLPAQPEAQPEQHGQPQA